MNPIKICVLTSTGETSHTILFSGNSQKFTAENEFHSVQKIHPDDSIRTIKMKLLHEFHKGVDANRIQLRPSYEEIYLYGFAKEDTTTLQLFDALKTEEEFESGVPLDTIKQIIAGHPDEKSILKKLPAGDAIPYSDFESILSEKQIEITVKTPLGITFAGGRRDATFEVDPFDVAKHRAYLTEHSNLHYFDDNLLLNHGKIIDDTIYVCLADRVFESTEPASEEYIARYYFAGLYKDGVKSNETLLSKRAKLVKSTQSLLTEERSKYYQSVDKFYEIAADGSPLEYISKGIRAITIRLKNRESKIANPEMLFKNMHCTKDVPYIKFNPGNRRENLYRFYFERTTRTGKKIPYLSRAHIMRMAKETGRGQQISVYLEGALSEATRSEATGRVATGRILSNCYAHFEPDGDIQLQLTFSTPIDEHTLDETIRNNILPHLSNIGRDVRQTGFILPQYLGLRNVANTKVVSLEYVCRTKAVKSVKIDAIPCIYSICTLNEEVPGKPPVARLKRVENFREMDAANILIAELYGQVQYGETGLQDIIDELVARGLSADEPAAKTLIAGFLSTINEMNGEIVEKPGFPLEVAINTEEGTLDVRITELTSIFYLDTVGVYIDAIVKMTQQYKESNPVIKQLKQLCKKAVKFREVFAEPEDSPKLLNAVTIPLKLNNTMDDDFFAQFASDDEEEEEYKANEEVDAQEDYDNAEDLFGKLHRNAQNIQKPVMFDDEEEEEEGATQPEKGPILFSEPDDSVETYVTKKEEITKPVTNDAKPIAPKPAGPIMFDSEDEDEEYGGAKKTNAADNLEDDEDEEDNDVVEDDDEEDDENRLVPDGMALKPVNPFLKKLRRRDPTLFMSRPNGKFKSFSTSCQPTSRHPVILNQEEMDRTDKSAYKHAVKYGSDPKNPNYFICPRFWCFLTNSAISEEDVKAGKCGAIIKKNADKIPKGSYVYELNEEAHIPGFIENKLANGKCLPCCFKKTWDNKTQSDARKRCESQIREANSDVVEDNEQETPDKKTRGKKGKPAEDKKQKKVTTKTAQYIYSLDTYPVPQHRWGFLPIPVQLFFQLDYRPAIDPNNPALLQDEQETFLRCGVEQSSNQSFLGCFADIYAHRQGLGSVPTVQDFRRILGEAINLDVFAKAHNGSLLSAFYPNNKKTVKKEDREKYKYTEFALALDLSDKANKRHFDDAILAYENFIEFITKNNESSKIDHQYLWDFICDDNSRIIPKGVNLVILEIRANDIIDRIELVCPTNLYSRHQYDAAKDTVILLKHDEFYEPVYLYESNHSGATKVTRFFSHSKVPGSVADLLKRIEDATRKYCPGMPSLPKIYRFANPVPIQRLLGALAKIDAKIESQVVNYQGKTIGLMVVEKEEPGRAVYLPCAPSARLLKRPIKYMDSPKILNDYDKTVATLNRINASSKIPCRPVWKIKEEEMVVGFLTETNQFVPVTPTEDIAEDGIRTYEGVDEFAADKTVATDKKGDSTRIKLTKYIVLEGQFYHAFRNRVRILLSEFENSKLKNEMRKIADDQTLIYSQKIEKLERLVERLIKGYVVFVDIDKSVLMDMAEVNECDDADDEGPNCIIKENGVAQLVVPKWHLISKYDNERIYVGRMADELVRNDRVKSIMYDTANRLNSKTTEYQIKDDEFILVQSALTPEYFADMDSSRDSNPYAKQTNYELAHPSISVVYPNEKIPLSEQYQPAVNDDAANNCLARVSKIIGNQKQVWDRIFREDAREHIFRDTADCTFQPIRLVVESKLGETWTVTDIKNKLSAAYLKLFEQDPANLSKIAKIMREQGKMKMFAKSIASPGAFQDIVMSDGYYLSDIDIWALANEYNLPIVVFNANGLKGVFAKSEGNATDTNTQWIKMGGNKTDKYHFIRSKIRVGKGNHIYEYNLIVPAVVLGETKEFEKMVIESLRVDRLNTMPLNTALQRIY